MKNIETMKKIESEICKETYETPTLDVVRFDNEDVITTSNIDDGEWDIQ